MTTASTYEFETIEVEVRERVALVTLNRPDRLNALDDRLMSDSGRLWRQLKHDSEVWAVVLTGAGRGFCAGGDVKQFADEQARGGALTGGAGLFDGEHRGWGPRAYDFQKPIVVAVNGVCSGGGLDYVTEADIVVASTAAQFFDSHVSIGFVSSHESVQLARRIPLGEVMMMALMGNSYRMSAERAYELGLVQRVVAPEVLLDEAMSVAEAICANSPGAVWGTKQSIWHGLGLSIQPAKEIAQRYLRAQVDRPDHKEGPRAFAERRPPRWQNPSWTWED